MPNCLRYKEKGVNNLHNFRRGFRNVWRSKVRTVLVALLAGAALALAVCMLAVQSGVQRQVEGITDSIGTAVTISPPGSFGGFGMTNPMEQELLAPVSSIEHVAGINHHLIGTLSDTDSAAAPGGMRQRKLVFGTDLQGTLSLLGAEVSLTAGRTFTADDQTGNVVILGERLVEEQGLSLGDSYQMAGREFRIIGVIDGAGNRFFGSATVLPLAVAQEVLGLSGQITQATVTVDNLANVESVVTALQAALGDVADVTSGSSQPLRQAGQSLSTIQSSMQTALIVSLAAAGLVIFCTMLLIVRERTREVGVLKVLGASPLDLLSGFAVEAVSLALLACVVGSLLFALGGNTIAQAMLAGQSGVGQGARAFGLDGGRVLSRLGGLDVQLRLLDLGKLVLASIGLGILGSLLPALYAVRLKPAEVLRND